MLSESFRNYYFRTLTAKMTMPDLKQYPKQFSLTNYELNSQVLLI